MTADTQFMKFAQQVDAELRQIFASRKLPLYDMMAYHLGWGDRPGATDSRDLLDRVHGVLCLVVCEAVGGELNEALPAAAAVELVHKFCQIHDDVQGGKPKRGERDAVWWVWGPAQAINAGDGMHALARLAMLRLLDVGVNAKIAFRAVQFLDEAGLRACEGRFLDLHAQEQIDTTTSGYLRMAADKEGALYACAMQLGALVAGGDEACVEAMRQSGLALGVAMQIRSEIADLSSPDSANEDVMNKKKMLPLIKAFESASTSQRRQLGDVYFKRVLEPADLPKVLEVLEDLGAIDASSEVLKKHVLSAEMALEASGLSGKSRERLTEFLGSLLGS
ncbi:polyprenyl synthetase family protein [Dehalococcoidia bacterium]|nr:polyprenyl synthetase family protein [Dehalococcoidia bacterium]